jgi:hypothetical protein
MRRSSYLTFRTPLGLAVVAAAMIAGTALPASAAAGDTVTTITMTGGSLSMTPAATATLAANVGAATANGSLGTVSVSDTRGTAAGWTVSAISTVFTNAPSVTVAGAVSYSAGASTATSGATFTPAGATVITGVLAVGTATAPGSNSASFNPTLTVTLPLSGVLAGSYTGTVTTSIA